MPSDQQILEDLQAFTDRGTEPRARKVPNAGRTKVTWIQDGETYSLSRTTGDPDAQLTLEGKGVSGRFVGPYRSVLMQRPFFDFAQAASRTRGRMQPIVDSSRSSSEVDHWGGIAAPADFVPPAGVIRANASVRHSEDLLRSLSDDLTNFTRGNRADGGKTRLILIKAPAGLGKTSLLRQLAMRRAEENASAKNAATWNSLFLYADVQGRRLRKPRDVFAGAIDRQDWVLNTDRLPLLVRNNVIVPIVDGFDELLGTANDDNDFNEFENWLRSIRGGGYVVISARTAYAERQIEQRFMKVEDPREHELRTWDLTVVDVDPWGDELIAKFAKKRLSSAHSDDLDQLETFFSNLGPDSPIRTPFFVNEICKLSTDRHPTDPVALDELLNQENTDAPTALIRLLTDAFLRREAVEKILDSNNRPIVSIDDLYEYCRTLAYLLWDSDEPELRSDELIGYFPFPADLPEDRQELVSSRLRDFALLTPGEDQGTYRFSHELFREFFTALDLHKEFAEGAASTFERQLGRKPMSPSSITNFVDLVIHDENADANGALLRLATATHAQSGAASITRKTNASGLIGAFLEALTDVSGVHFKHLTIDGPRDFGTTALTNCTFEDVQMNHCDFRSFDFGDSRGSIQLHMARIASSPNGTRLNRECQIVWDGVEVFSPDLPNGSRSTHNYAEIDQLTARCYPDFKPAAEEVPRGLPYNEVAQSCVYRLRREFANTPEVALDDKETNLTEIWGQPFINVLLETSMCERRVAPGPVIMLRSIFRAEQLDAPWDSPPTDLLRGFWTKLVEVFPA